MVSKNPRGLSCKLIIGVFSRNRKGGYCIKKITLSNGKIFEVECLSCALSSGLIEPDGGVVFETKYFHAHQDVAYPIKGLIILASKRHIKSFDELTEEEKLDYIQALTRIRQAQREILNIEYVYYFYRYYSPFPYLDGSKT